MLNKKLHLSKNVFNANIKQESTRQGFGDALVHVGYKNEDVVVLTADLTDSTKVDKFAEAFPDRFIEVGIAEQNMAGIAAGLALSGKTPFMSSYAAFSPGRNWEQIRLALCYTNSDVKIAGSHSGFSPGRDGATHQALEDIALTRVLPNMTVLVPADFLQAQRAVEEAALLEGPVYIRLNRNKSPVFTTKKTPFSVGKAQVLMEGKDLTIVATGPIAYEALKAAREVALKHKKSIEVINAHTIKPFDEKTLITSARKTGQVLTVEEHQIAGGLGSLVSEVLSEKHPTKVTRMGAKDTFGESGNRDELLDKYELDSKHIIKKIKSLIVTKK